MYKRIHAHVPYPMLAGQLDFIIAERINVEIFFSAESLDALSMNHLAEVAGRMHAVGVEATIHAPFIDLNPGSFEPKLREATLYRFHQVLDAAAIVRPKVMVFHPGYDRWRYGDHRERWLRESIEVWLPVVRRAEEINTIVAVENIFDEEPSTFVDLFRELASPHFRHCFDVGHWNLFAKVGMEEWFSALGRYIAEVHLHDNTGTRDDHLPVGEGAIDFLLLFDLLERHAPEAVHTLEAHTPDRLKRSRNNMAQLLKKRQASA